MTREGGEWEKHYYDLRHGVHHVTVILQLDHLETA